MCAAHSSVPDAVKGTAFQTVTQAEAHHSAAMLALVLAGYVRTRSLHRLFIPHPLTRAYCCCVRTCRFAYTLFLIATPYLRLQSAGRCTRVITVLLRLVVLSLGILALVSAVIVAIDLIDCTGHVSASTFVTCKPAFSNSLTAPDGVYRKSSMWIMRLSAYASGLCQAAVLFLELVVGCTCWCMERPVEAPRQPIESYADENPFPRRSATQDDYNDNYV